MLVKFDHDMRARIEGIIEGAGQYNMSDADAKALKTLMEEHDRFCSIAARAESAKEEDQS